MQPLSGKRALVVGLAGSYADTVVRTLHEAGASVAMVDSDAVTFERLAERADASLVCDMSEGGIAQAISDLEGRGHVIDILVTCPPALAMAPVGTDASFLREVMAQTLEPAFLWTAAIAPVMQARRSGVIVHLTGLSGLGGWRGWHASGAAFAAIHNMVQSFVLDVAADNVRINVLIPGIGAAQARQIAATSGQTVDAVKERIPLNAFMPEEALGHALLYLVHESSSYVTGETLAVDGGWDIWGRLYAVAK